jgi:DNA damage-inducible protein 1
MEEAPELVAQSTTMLYVPMTVNGEAVSAFIDSGAQMTIMNKQMAERCGLMRLVDKRFAGTAVGVGTQKILGRVLQVAIKIGGAHLPCSLSVMETGPDFLFGLDMLRRHQCCINLKANVLEIGSSGEAIPFMADGAIPKSFPGHPAEDGQSQEDDELAKAMNESARGAEAAAAAAPPPAAVQLAPPPPEPVPPVSATAQLTALGFSEALAAEALAACGGNVEHAASLLFSGGGLF